MNPIKNAYQKVKSGDCGCKQRQEAMKRMAHKAVDPMVVALKRLQQKREQP